MKQFELDIVKARIESQLHQDAMIEGTDFNTFLKSFKECLQDTYDRDMFMKSWSSDLQAKFPEGSFKTINGAAVFINNGKVVAGLGGFNGMIDDYFSAKEKEDGDNKPSKENKSPDIEENANIDKIYKDTLSQYKNAKNDPGRQKEMKRILERNSQMKDEELNEKQKEFKQASIKLLKKINQEESKENQSSNQPKEEEKKDKPVNERTQQEIHEAKQKIADTMPKPINKMTWEEFKPYGIEMAKQAAHSQPESYYERMAKHEHDWATKNDKSQYDVSEKQKESKDSKVITLDTFKEIAKKAKDPKDFIEQTKKITNVPPEVAKEFYEKYADGGKLSQEQSAKKFMEEVNGETNQKNSKNYAFDVTVNGKKYFAEKVKGENKYIAFDENGKRIADGFNSTKKDFEDLIKYGSKKLKEKNEKFNNPKLKSAVEFVDESDKLAEDLISKYGGQQNIPQDKLSEYRKRFEEHQKAVSLKNEVLSNIEVSGGNSGMTVEGEKYTVDTSWFGNAKSSVSREVSSKIIEDSEGNKASLRKNSKGKFDLYVNDKKMNASFNEINSSSLHSAARELYLRTKILK